MILRQGIPLAGLMGSLVFLPGCHIHMEHSPWMAEGRTHIGMLSELTKHLLAWRGRQSLPKSLPIQSLRLGSVWSPLQVVGRCCESPSVPLSHLGLFLEFLVVLAHL